MLDTNVLHYVRLYLSYAKDGAHFPHPGVEWSSTENRICDTIDDQRLRDALLSGGRVLHFMKCNSAEISRCSAVELEWFRLEAFSCALGTAVRGSRVSGRWFNRFDDRQVNRWMKPDDRKSIARSLDEIFATLDSLGVRVSDLGSSASSDVVWLARGIMTLVYMDPLDSVVYAHALVATATHLVTSDGPFRAVVNRFRNPPDEARAETEALSSLVRRCTGLDLLHTEFPVSQKIPRLRP